MANWEKVCLLEELPPGTSKVFPLGVWNILVINAGKRLYACGNECPHLGEPLSKGEVQGHTIRCPAHGYKMDLSNGQCLTEAGLQVPVFPVEVRDGAIWIEI